MIFPIDTTMMASLIQKALPDASVQIDDLRGDGRYYQAIVVSPAFQGKPRLEQHRMVHAILLPSVGEAIENLQLTTRAA